MTKPVALATVPLSRFHTIDASEAPAVAPFRADDLALADTDVLGAFMDFRLHNPLVVPATTTIESARRWIRQARSRLLIVVDPLETFLGVVSVADLFSGRASLVAAVDGGYAKTCVADIMTPKSELVGVPRAALVSAEADDVRKTLDDARLPWMLVVDVERHAVCGLVLRDALDESVPLEPSLMRRAALLGHSTVPATP